MEDHTVRMADTLQMRIVTSLGRPLRYRVLQSGDSAKEPWLRLEMQYPRLDSLTWRRKERNKRYELSEDGLVRVTIPLQRLVPWKIDWQGSDLVLSWISPEARPLWKSPWMMAGVGGAVVGGVAVWILGSNSHAAPASSEQGVIPPPDIVLPR